MRCLGVDFGSKRIGLAVSDAAGLVSPLKVLAAGPSVQHDARAVLQAAEAYAVEAIVVGLPLNMNGSAGPQAKLSQRLADALRHITAVPVHLHDERLTSYDADRRLLERALTRKKKKARHDAVAAQIMLESFLERSDQDRP